MLEELKTFIAVVEHKNFTKAAEEIKLSQPSVSLHIKHLEEYYGVTFIQRSIKQKNIVITPAGNLLYERAKQIVKLLEETKLDLMHYDKTISGHLKIGASFTIGEYFLPHFLGEFSKKYPSIEFEVIIDNTASICDKVKKFQLDLGLIEGMVPSFNFEYDHFYEDNMVLALPYNHPIVKSSSTKLHLKTFEGDLTPIFSNGSPTKVTYKDEQLEAFQNVVKATSKNFNNSIEDDALIKKLQNQTWISREIGSGTRDYLNFFLTSNNIHPKNIIVFGSNYSVKEAVKNNLGFTFISSFVVTNSVKNKEIAIIETENKYTRHFSYILSKRSITSKAATVFTEMLKENETISN